MPGMRLEHLSFVEGAGAIEYEFDVTLSSLQRDTQVGHGNVVEIVPTQVVTYRWQIEAEEALARDCFDIWPVGY